MLMKYIETTRMLHESRKCIPTAYDTSGAGGVPIFYYEWRDELNRSSDAATHGSQDDDHTTDDDDHGHRMDLSTPTPSDSAAAATTNAPGAPLRRRRAVASLPTAPMVNNTPRLRMPPYSPQRPNSPINANNFLTTPD
jgi:hypothetical protein